ncbi:unnamed protein product [Paramecium sonneborni]|uniref:ubiquitinyl hydrolase 1 n=1 Tax=Paramecium sonneborni TaxID=65129 RepID=A0A8S1LYS0_9CILI|nr:unnamed protein product [Paramecium sonneborni]
MQQTNQQKHYTQSLRRCGLEAVNNLIQQNKYNWDDFQNIGNEIKKETKQSHSTYYLGNYDLNIIERVLDKENFFLEWVKANQNFTVELLADPQVFGLLINQIKELSFVERIFQWEPRHWISIRKNVKPDNELEYFYHDSKLSAAQCIQEPDMVQRLIELKKNKDNYFLLVKKK